MDREERLGEFMRKISEEMASGAIPDRESLSKRKRSLAKELCLDRIPGNPEIIQAISGSGALDESALELLWLKPSRSASGVAVVAVMTPPSPCPHGRCIYCPGGTSVGTPQSYTGHEPAAMRGGEYGYDGHAQVVARLAQTKAIGHSIDKVDLIIMGGTFASRPPDIQGQFVQSCLDAMNGRRSASLDEAIASNERAPSRCIGLTIESRPDWSKETHVDLMLSYGTTRVELGVQTLDQATLDRVKRSHTVEDTVDATRILKDSGLKVGYHLMPGLPGATIGSDLATFKQVFDDERFKPDLLKVYPTLVIEGTELYEMYERGEYRPYSTEECVELLALVKRNVPKWVRISRIQRDIPVQYIAAGSKRSDLRNLVLSKLKDEGGNCNCIRCREVGRVAAVKGEPELRVERYDSSGGEELFISVEDDGVLYGFARLRFPSPLAHRPEIAGRDVALIREIRVLGHSVPIGKRVDGRSQHTGLGMKLMNEAERLTVERGCKHILVMSGIGVREYFRRLGYNLNGPYMEKTV